MNRPGLWLSDTNSSTRAASLSSQLCAALEPFDARTALRVGEMLAEGMVPRGNSRRLTADDDE